MLRITEASGQEKLMYWGDRVERLVIDGVLDLEAYYSGDWRNQIEDADAALQIFFNGCVAAGPTLCAFKPTLYASVLASPVPAYVEGSSTYGLVDFSILKNAVKIGLYNPYTLFATIAQGLAELQSGNGITIYTMQLDDAPYECSREGSAEPYKNAWETVYAVACGDAVENTGMESSSRRALHGTLWWE
ncbi:hypothetical protein CPB85DRAFT_1377402 [Mucidula mucida]|nr:hypothetical protein CPB85DRAFT_1377402 [Mucidula mucida]